MAKWWEQYKDKNTEILVELADRLMAMSDKLEAKFWKREWEIYSKYGRPGGSSNLPREWRKKVSKIWEAKNKMIHPLWQDICDIYEYIVSIKQNA
jgi:hypothetical protein